MRRNSKFLILISVFVLSTVFNTICYGVNNVKKGDINKAKKVENYEVVIPPVLALDSRMSLTRNEINVIDKKLFDNLSKYKVLLRKEINTIGLKYSSAWVIKLQDVVNEIKKHPNTIIILEGFRNTELSGRENLNLSKKQALFIASIFRDVYRLSNTMAAIGKGLEKNENFNYNCVIISLIKDVNPSDTI